MVVHPGEPGISQPSPPDAEAHTALQKRFPHSGAFGTAKEATMGAIVLAMDFEWRTASGGAMVPLEAGFSRLDTLSLEEAVSHLALEREWRNPRPYSSRKTAQNISPVRRLDVIALRPRR